MGWMAETAESCGLKILFMGNIELFLLNMFNFLERWNAFSGISVLLNAKLDISVVSEK